MNKVIISGRLTKDVECRSNESGLMISRFTVASNRNFKNKDGNYDADFISCVAYRNTAEFVSKYFKKGDGIIVDGRIQTGSYDAQDGTKRYVTDVVVENVEFNGKAKEKNEPEYDGYEENTFDSIGTEIPDKEVKLEEFELPF